jgi:filamentous hemagglutinin
LFIDTAAAQIASNDRGVNLNDSSIKHYGAEVTAGQDLSIQAGRDLIVIGSQLNAGGNAALDAGNDLTIASSADEEHRYSKTKSVTEQEDHVHQNGSGVKAGGDVTLKAGNDLTLISSDVEAGGEAYLSAGNKLALLAAQDSDYSLYDMKKKGSFGSEKTQHDEVTDIKNIGSLIKSGGNLTLVSGGDQRYQGARLESGKDITLDSGGSITFEAVKDVHQESHTKSDNDAFWVSSEGKGSTDETLRQTQMVAGGSVTIKAVEGLHIDLNQINQNTVTQSIDAMVKADPQLAWLKDAEARGDVDWQLVQEIHDSFKYDTSGLGPASQLIIAIVMAAIVGPAALGALGTAGASAAWAAAGAAVATAAATNATVSFINNGGDIGAVFKDVTSRDALKGYVIAGVTAGFTAEYFSEWTDTKWDPNTGKITTDLGSLKGIGQFAANQGLQNASATALSKILGQGGDLGDALRTTLLNTLAAASFNAVGDYSQNLFADGSLGKIAIHAMVGGLLAKIAGGDFATGALAAGANEALVVQLNALVQGNPNLLLMSSQIVGVLAAATQHDVTADSLQNGAWVANNATQYNYLNHDQLAQAAKELRACNDAACREELVARYKDLSFAQDLEAAAACSASPASCAAYSKEVANTMANLDDIYQILGDGPSHEWESLRQSNLGFQDMLATFTAGHTSASIAEAMQQKWGLSDEETRVVAENLVLVAAGGFAAIAAKKALAALKTKSDATVKNAVGASGDLASSKVKWVDENAGMSSRARDYNDSATGARSNPATQSGQAPALERTMPDGSTRLVKFDGVDGDVLVDRKISVVTTSKSKDQALRQSDVLSQNGLTARWEVPTQAQAARAQKMFDELGIKNISVKVIHEPGNQ